MSNAIVPLLLSAAAFAATAGIATVASTAHAIVTEQVDLAAPGAVDNLKKSRPGHYAKVSAIVAYIESNPVRPSSRSLIEARFDAADVQMLQWRVSDPPKLRLSFTLDSTRYTTEVIPHLPPARAIPTR